MSANGPQPQAKAQVPGPNATQIQVLNELLKQINELVHKNQNCKHVQVSVPVKNNSKTIQNIKNSKAQSFYNVVVCKRGPKTNS